MTGAEHHTPTHHQHHHDDVDWAEHAAANELEAEVLISILEASAALVADQARTDAIDVRLIIDIGPGPGVGTSVLAERFADAEVIAVDGSDAMLARVDDRAANLGFAHRLRTIHADLPAGLVGLERADVLWASMVLHHLGDERAMLAAIRSALAPGGVLAISEFGDPMRFLPEATGTEPPGFQARLAAAGAAWVAQMREGLPDAMVSADYPTMLRDAGFELVTDTLVTARLDPPLSTDARTVVGNHLRRRRDGDRSILEPADAAALDALLDADNPNGIMQRPDVFLEGSRHLYIARVINPEVGLMRDLLDVIVVGGGAAGLSGALMLGRSRRSVLVIDAGEPRNAPAAGVHGFITRDGMDPRELLAVGRDEVRVYGVDVTDGRARTAERTDAGFAVTLGDGTVVHGRRLLVTTGLVDELPDIAGLRERWGREVVHCPYCHGWEFRDQAIGVLASGSRPLHRALMFRQLTDDVTLFQHTAPELTDDELEQLTAREITIVRGEIDALEITGDRLTGVRLQTGELIARDALAIAPRFVARAEVLESLALEVTEHPLGLGSFIESDATGATAVPGVWVAGNVADLMAQVVGAAAAGAIAGAAINADLIAQEVGDAVAVRRRTNARTSAAPAGS